MSVSFVEYRKEMLEAYEAVMNDKDDTDWALYSYKANNELYLESTGDEGLDELESEFNNGKMQYAFVRINDPNTNMKKYLLIVWQGEGVPATRKGAAANHVRDVKRFFKAHHMTIFARCDDDVTPDEIMRQVLKTTSNFSFVQPSADVSGTGPVGSVYKPVRPIEEIKKVKNESFWERIQAEEESRKKEEMKKQRERQQLEEARLKEEQQRSEKKRKEIEKQRELDIIDKMKAQKLADDNKAEKLAEKAAWQEQLKEQEQAMENQRRNRRTSSVEHTQEAQHMITQRTNNPRAMWAQREKEQKQNQRNERVAPPTRKLSNSFGNRFNQQPEVPATPAPTPVTPTLPSVPVVDVPEPVFEDNAFEEQPEPQPTYEDISYQQPQEEVYDEAATQQTYDVAQDDYTRQQEAVYGEPEEQPVYDEATTPTTYNDQPIYEEAGTPTTTAGGDTYDVATNEQYNEQTNGQHEAYYEDTSQDAVVTQQSECRVRALYDYQAVDDSEISFDPDDVITQVEQIDEGWWRGVAPNGSYGLFPANYVEII